MSYKYPDFGVWKLTQEQVEQIKNSNVDVMTEVYNDNYILITGKAWRFIRNHTKRTRSNFVPSRYSIDDLMQQVYVDLPYFDYTNKLTIGKSLFRCFRNVEIGGFTSTSMPKLGVCVLDAPIKRNSGSLRVVDFIPAKEETQENKKKEQIPDAKIDFWLKSLLTESEYKVMQQLIFTNFTDYEISDMLGMARFNGIDKIRRRSTRTLSKNYWLILEELKKLQCEYGEQYANVIPARVEKAITAMKSFKLTRE